MSNFWICFLRDSYRQKLVLIRHKIGRYCPTKIVQCSIGIPTIRGESRPLRFRNIPNNLNKTNKIYFQKLYHCLSIVINVISYILCRTFSSVLTLIFFIKQLEQIYLYYKKLRKVKPHEYPLKIFKIHAISSLSTFMLKGYVYFPFKCSIGTYYLYICKPMKPYH